MFFYGFAIGDMVYMENYDDDHKAVAIGGVTIACLSIVFSHTWDDTFTGQLPAHNVFCNDSFAFYNGFVLRGRAKIITLGT